VPKAIKILVHIRTLLSEALESFFGSVVFGASPEGSSDFTKGESGGYDMGSTM